MSQDNQGSFFEVLSLQDKAFSFINSKGYSTSPYFHMQSPGSFPILFLNMNRNQRSPEHLETFLYGRLPMGQAIEKVNTRKTYNSGNKMEKHILLSYRKGFFK